MELKTIPLSSFDIVFNRQWQDLLDQKISANDLLTFQVEINNKLCYVKNINWKFLSTYKNLFSSQNFNQLIQNDFDNYKILIKALTNDLLEKQTLKILWDYLPEKELFYKSIRSFKTLFLCEQIDIDVWTPIKLNDGKSENLLPVVVWDWENRRKDLAYSDKLKSDKKYDFFVINKDKWQTIQTPLTSSAQFHSRIAYRISFIKSQKNLLKPLNISIDNNVLYPYPWGETHSIKDLFLSQGKLNKIKDEQFGKNNLETELINLVTLKIDYNKANLITRQKKFKKFWTQIINKIDFNFNDSVGNLFHHTFHKQKLKNMSFYIPFNNLNNIDDKKDFKYFYDNENKNSHSLYEWCNYLIKKNVDIIKPSNIEKSPFVSLLLYLSLQRKEKYGNFFEDSSFILKKWNEICFEEKKVIFNSYMDSWDKLRTVHLDLDFSTRYNSYDNKAVIESILDLFEKEKLFQHCSAYNKSILELLDKYKDKDPLSYLFKSICAQDSHAKLEILLPNKNEKIIINKI